MDSDPLRNSSMVDMLALVDEWKNAIEVEVNPDLKRVLEESLRLYFNGDNEQTVDGARCAFSKMISSSNHDAKCKS